MAKKSFLTVTDQFCGAGGSSQGARRLAEKLQGGLEVRLALNHWKLAIETHNINFPDTMHDCTDISACDPRRYPSTDILITSPECTNHSLAKGIKIVKKQMGLYETGVLDASAERSRATMWDVCRFAEYHKYNIIIVENVVDARKWVMFDAWIMAMHSLGYLHKCVYLNSMHCHPTPQSRDRMYVVFWKKGNKAPVLDYTPVAHCPKCSKDVSAIQTWKNKLAVFGKYRTQYVYCCPACSTICEPYYYASFNCIDWSDRGKRIGDRETPLSDNTLRRIEFGLKKYGKQALIVNDQQSTGIGHRVRSTQEYLNTIPTQPHFKLIMPLVIKGEHTLQDGMVRSSVDAMQTQLTRQTMSVLVPFLVDGNYDAKPSRAAAVTEPVQTINTQARNGIAFPPMIIENKGTSNARGITEVLGCATGVNYHGLLTNEAFSSFIQSYYGQTTLNAITEPLGTATTKERHLVVSYQEPKIEDCYYRMLKPPEIKIAMAFDRNYIVCGSGKDQVKQLGNAVTPPAMEWLLQQCISSLQ